MSCNSDVQSFSGRVHERLQGPVPLDWGEGGPTQDAPNLLVGASRGPTFCGVNFGQIIPLQEEPTLPPPRVGGECLAERRSAPPPVSNLESSAHGRILRSQGRTKNAHWQISGSKSTWNLPYGPFSSDLAPCHGRHAARGHFGPARPEMVGVEGRGTL